MEATSSSNRTMREERRGWIALGGFCGPTGSSFNAPYDRDSPFTNRGRVIGLDQTSRSKFGLARRSRAPVPHHCPEAGTAGHSKFCQGNSPLAREPSRPPDCSTTQIYSILLLPEVSLYRDAVYSRTVVVTGQVVEVDSAYQIFLVGYVATEYCKLPATITEGHARS